MLLRLLKAMSKLALYRRVPGQYDVKTFADLFRHIEQQVNALSEGRVSARHASMTAAPTAGEWAIGDIVWNSAPASASYIGWVCTVSGTPGTWKGFGVIA